MADDLTLRTCGRTGCRWPAAASLSFRYGTGQVWLLDLSPEPDPALYDLCPHHADMLTVPRGWERVDQRRSRAAVAEPAGRDLDPTGGGEPPGAGGYGGNRYAALTAALPRLAREYQDQAQPEPQEDRCVEPSGHMWPEASTQRGGARPSRDLAPVPVEEAVGAPVAGQGEGTERAVVVPLEGKGRRRA